MKHCIPFIFSLLLIICSTTFAQNLKKAYAYPHCKLFLKDGRVIDSYLMAGHNMINQNDSSVKVNNNPYKLFGKTEKYRNTEIDSMQEWYDDEPEYIVRRYPVRICYYYTLNSTMDDSIHSPSMAIQIYRGQNIDGYMVWDIMMGFRYLYKTKNMEVAHAYIGVKHKLTNRRKQFLREEFKHHPQVINFINSIDQNSFKDNPELFLAAIDAIIEEENRNKPNT